jgi:hypothetical protein
VPVDLADSTFKEKRERKWPFFVFIAAERFINLVAVGPRGSWLQMRVIMLPPVGVWALYPTTVPLLSSYRGSCYYQYGERLDVLMVWHAALLNPSWFRTLGFNDLAQCVFPWEKRTVEV